MTRLRVKELAEERGWKEADLVRLTGHAPNTVRAYLRGSNTRLDLPVLESFAAVFGTSVAALFSDFSDFEKTGNKDKLGNQEPRHGYLIDTQAMAGRLGGLWKSRHLAVLYHNM